MAVRFVATEILSSADGLSHGETQVLETDEVRAARAAGGGGGKTLYEQLEAEREKQQEAYDANTKALGAGRLPPVFLFAPVTLRQLVSHRINRVVTPPVPPATIAAYEQKIDMLLRELHKYES